MQNLVENETTNSQNLHNFVLSMYHLKFEIAFLAQKSLQNYFFNLNIAVPLLSPHSPQTFL